MPARPFAPTNVVRQHIDLLDNLKASGNVALYEEARAAVFDRHALELQSAIMGNQGVPVEGVAPGAIPSFGDDPSIYYEGPQMGSQYIPEIPLNIVQSAGPPIGGVAPGSIPALGDDPGPYFEGPQMGESQQPTTFSDLVNN